MKKLTIIGLVLMLTAFFSCQQEKKGEQKPTPMKTDKTFTVSGQIEGASSLSLFYLDGANQGKRAQIEIHNGKFQFTDSIDGFAMARIWPQVEDDSLNFRKAVKGGRGFIPTKSSYTLFIASPGAHIKINGKVTDYMEAYPSGDQYNAAVAKINKEVYPLYNKTANLAVKGSYAKNAAEKKQIDEEAGNIGKEITQKLENFIKNNPDKLVSSWYLNDMLIRSQVSDQEATELFKRIQKPKAEENVFYAAVQARVKAMEATKEGAPVPAISTTATLDGEHFDIASYRGKYILIDFWGTWCGPCVGEMPRLKEFYNKHKDKMYVLGVDSGDTKEQVKKFLEEKGYQWQQILSSKESGSSDNFVNRFNVQGFPTKIIVSPDGKILKRFTGASEAPFDFLEKSFEEDAKA